jgi:formate--tetrahydrofolate ligase
MRHILDVAAALQIAPEELLVYGEHMAKLRLRALPAKDACRGGG